MSQRGSAQLLLLFFRARKRGAWAAGVVAGAIAGATLVQTTGHYPADGVLIQGLRQTAWRHALAKLPAPTQWPWTDEVPAAVPSVPRLGISASLIEPSSHSDGVPAVITPAPAQDPHLPAAKFGELNLGDHITVTSASGSSLVCRVTGRKAADPHLADDDATAGEESLVTCPAVDPRASDPLTLVIQATKTEPPVAAGPEL